MKVYHSSCSPAGIEVRTMKITGMSGCVKHIVLSAFWLIFGYVQASPYEEFFQKALEEEAAQNWTAAIQNYLEAQQAEPSKTFPEERIRDIFRAQLKAGESINALRILLPKDLDQKFEREGVYSLEAPKGSRLSVFWNVLIWGFIISLLCLGAWVIYRQVRQNESQAQKEQEQADIANTRQAPRRTPSLPTEHRPQKAIVITEKTRERMQSMMSSVQSLTGEMKRPDDFQELEDEEFEKLKDSGVVRALAETLLSEVSIEQSPSGKYSKMTLDASLFFDESDVDFFEEEFGETKN